MAARIGQRVVFSQWKHCLDEMMMLSKDYTTTSLRYLYYSGDNDTLLLEPSTSVTCRGNISEGKHNLFKAIHVVSLEFH